MNTIHQKSFFGVKNAGFTLIELLVVVLIIGILAAVALPQYQKAVRKARFVEALTYLKTYQRGEEAFFMANGYYSEYPADLDIEMPLPAEAVSNEDKGFFIIPSRGIWMDVLGPTPDTWWVSGGLATIAKGSTSYVDIVRDLTYTIYLDHSSFPGKVSCSGRTPEFEQMCKTLVP